MRLGLFAWEQHHSWISTQCWSDYRLRMTAALGHRASISFNTLKLCQYILYLIITNVHIFVHIFDLRSCIFINFPIHLLILIHLLSVFIRKAGSIWFILLLLLILLEIAIIDLVCRVISQSCSGICDSFMLLRYFLTWDILWQSRISAGIFINLWSCGTIGISGWFKCELNSFSGFIWWWPLGCFVIDDILLMNRWNGRVRWPFGSRLFLYYCLDWIENTIL